MWQVIGALQFATTFAATFVARVREGDRQTLFGLTLVGLAALYSLGSWAVSKIHIPDPPSIPGPPDIPSIPAPPDLSAQLEILDKIRRLLASVSSGREDARQEAMRGLAQIEADVGGTADMDRILAQLGVSKTGHPVTMESIRKRLAPSTVL